MLAVVSHEADPANPGMRAGKVLDRLPASIAATIVHQN